MVSKKDGGNCPVVNLKRLNQFLVYEHFKMEGIHMLRDLLRKGGYLVKINLKDSYLAVPIWKGHQKYLRFLWKDTMLEFACLPFGLATAPSLQKIDETCGSHVETEGCASNHLFKRHFDNGRVRRSSAASCCLDPESPRTSGICNQLYKIPTCTKSVDRIFRLPHRFLTMSLQLPSEKLRKIRKQCKQLLNLGQFSIRELSKFLGLLTSSIQAVFPAPLHYRHLQRLKNVSWSPLNLYEAVVVLNPQAKEEIVWWRDHL